MNSKIQALDEIQNLLSAYHIDKNDILKLYKESTNKKPLSLITLLYFLVGAVFFARGFGIFIGKFSFDKQLISIAALSFSVLLNLGAYIIKTRYKQDLLSSGLFFVATLIFGVSLSFTLNYYKLQIPLLGNTHTFAILFFIWCTSLWLATKNNVFALFSLLYGAHLLYVTIGLISGTHITPQWTVFGLLSNYCESYRSLIIGIVLIALGRIFSNKKQFLTSELFYAYGSILFLFTYKNLAPQMTSVYPLHIILVYIVTFALLDLWFYASVSLRSNAFYLLGSIYLIFYSNSVLKPLSTYLKFSYELERSILLIIAGSLLIILGYFWFKLRKRYFWDMFIYKKASQKN